MSSAGGLLVDPITQMGNNPKLRMSLAIPYRLYHERACSGWQGKCLGGAVHEVDMGEPRDSLRRLAGTLQERNQTPLLADQL